MIYVLTEEHNDYNQHGAYFVHAWNHKPSKEELLKFGCDHFGRVENEYSWFNLEEFN